MAGAIPVDEGGYTNVDVETFAAMREEGDFVLVNVHVPYAGEIPGTDVFVPFDQIEGSLDRFPSDTGARIVLYCRSDSMGVTAATELVRLGYTDVWNLDGGMNAWTASGRELRHA